MTQHKKDKCNLDSWYWPGLICFLIREDKSSIHYILICGDAVSRGLQCYLVLQCLMVVLMMVVMVGGTPKTLHGDVSIYKPISW